MPILPPRLNFYGRVILLCLSVAAAEANSTAAVLRLPRFLARFAQSVPLALGRSVSREIGAAEVHTYSLDLGQRQYVRVLVNQAGVDVVITFIEPGGARTTVDRPNGARG